MRILYDATPLLMRSAGVKNYHHSLLSQLMLLIWPHEITLFPYLDELTPNHNERSNYSTLETYRGLGAVLASNYLRLPTAKRAVQGADVFHVTPHLWHPPEGPVLTSMVHDPTPLLMPEVHTASNVRYFEHFAANVLPRLDAMIVPSYAVKNDLMELCGVEEERISVVMHGVDEDFFEATPAQREVSRTQYGLPDRYILFVGSMEPRKNLSGLLEAFASLPEKTQRSFPLVIVGATGWRNQEIRDEIGKNPNVKVIGYVSRELLPAVYEQCSLFVFPSHYEGFGMPVLEAMAAGAPVITSNASALPEVIGDTGITIDPEDSAALATSMAKILDDPQNAALMGSAARQRARRFTWERCALETKHFFEMIAESTER
ncbi:MAG: glycosyltransferase family 1 protein [Bryobacterales bacterium]